jgi:hypothetical protein
MQLRMDISAALCGPEVPVDLRATRLVIPPILRIHLIHLRKVRHIGEKYIDFDSVLKRTSCSLEDA